MVFVNDQELRSLMEKFSATKCKYKVKGYVVPENVTHFQESCGCKPVNGILCGDGCVHMQQGMNCHENCHDEICKNQFIRTNSGGFGLVPCYTKTMDIGVKTCFKICKDDYVISYIGEMIDQKTYDHRLKSSKSPYGVYIQPNCIMDNLLYGNIARYLNHSCDPNLRLEIWYLDNKPVPTLWANRDIYPGEELFFDYKLKLDPGRVFNCRCRSSKCRYRPRDAESVTGFNCVLCEGLGSFSTKQYLDQHYKVKHKVTWKPIVPEHLKENECKDCGKLCQYPSTLHDHIKSHLDVLMEQCATCEKWFKSEKTLKAHRHKVHQEDVYNKNR